MEDFAWRAFRLNGSIEAYLLHLSLVNMLRETGITNGEDERIDNKAIRLR